MKPRALIISSLEQTLLEPLTKLGCWNKVLSIGKRTQKPHFQKVRKNCLKDRRNTFHHKALASTIISYI